MSEVTVHDQRWIRATISGLQLTAVAACLLSQPLYAASATAAATSATASSGADSSDANADASSDKTKAAAEGGDVTQLQEVVVTAQRRSESIQTVPVAVTAITSEDIEKANVKGVDDVFNMTPNVSFVSNGSRDRKDLSIRGISNQLDPYSDVRPSAYAFYIDDFNVAAGTSNPEIQDLERIEVLRGPQGTYFGRNALGGAINITTVKPNDDWFSQVDLGYGSFNTQTVGGIVNVPVAPGLFDMRISGKMENSDGNIKNINEIGGGNDSKFGTARVSTRFTPNARTTLDTEFSWTKEDSGMRSGVPTGFLTATWRSIYYSGATGDVADGDGVGFYPSNRDKVNFNRPQSVGTDMWYVSSRLNYLFDTTELTAVAGYLSSKPYNHGDVDGSSYDYFYEDDLMKRSSKSLELRLASQPGGIIDWTVGGMVGQDKGSTDQGTYFGSAGLYGMDEGTMVSGVDSSASTDYSALFAQGTWHITNATNLTLGGRYSHEKVSYDYNKYTTGGALSGASDRSAPFNDFSPKITLDHTSAGGVFTYATISKGFKSGGVQIASQDIGNTYKAEKLWNYETGLKFDMLDKRLRADISAFYMDWKDVQVQSRYLYLNSSGDLDSVTGIGNAASAESYGADASLTALVMPNLTLDAHAGYDLAKFKSYDDALVDGQTFDASGSAMINAPKWTAGADLDYRHHLVADYQGFARLEWTYRGKTLSSSYALLYKDSPFVAPGYNTTNLRLGIENEHITITAYVENLFDSNYYTNAYEKAFYSGVQVEPSYQMIGINLSMRMF